MSKITNELIDWAIRTIQTKYPDDVCLLIGHTHWNIAPDGDDVAFNFFIPRTDKGYTLSKTFIIDDIGYDLFPMSWERVEGLANLNEGLTTCLADGVILYARTPEDRQRFEALQEKLKTNLANPEFTYLKGLEKINSAMELYKNMMFEQDMCKVRKASGYIANFLGLGITMVNGTYFERGPENQIAILQELKAVPEGFTQCYLDIVNAKTVESLKQLTFQMIEDTRRFFEQRTPVKEVAVKTYNYEDLAAWYEEGVYTFRRIYYYAGLQDVFNTFAWGYLFQQEFDAIEEDFGLVKMDLMGYFDPENLTLFSQKAKEIDDYIATTLQLQGVTLRKYDTLDEFLKVHG